MNLGAKYKKKYPFNSNLKKNYKRSNNKKVFVFGPSLVRSFSICENFVPIFVEHALKSTFLNRKLSKYTFDKYVQTLKQLSPGSKIVLCMSMQDPDIHLRNEYKTKKRNTSDVMKFSAKENINLARYAQKTLKLNVTYLLGWPHLKRRNTELVKKYNFLLKQECEKYSIKTIDISKYIKDKNGNMRSQLCSIPNDIHPKTEITKYLYLEMFNKKFNKAKLYEWNSLLNLNFNYLFNFKIWPTPYIGESNSAHNQLVQYCNLKEKIANILSGFAIKNKIKIYNSLDSSEANLELLLGKNIFSEINLYYAKKKKKEMTEEIISLANRHEIKTNYLKNIKLKKLKNNIIFFNLYELNIKKINNFINYKLIKENYVFIFGIKKKVDYILKKNNFNENINTNFENRFLVNSLKKSKLCLIK